MTLSSFFAMTSPAAAFSDPSIRHATPAIDLAAHRPPGGVPARLFEYLRDDPGADGAPAFANGEVQALLQRDGLD